jgi:hypothetical protein
VIGRRRKESVLDVPLLARLDQLARDLRELAGTDHDDEEPPKERPDVP